MGDSVPHDDMSRRLIAKRAGVGAGVVVACRSWLRTLETIRQLDEITRPGGPRDCRESMT